MTSPNHVIENPLSGERITIMERPRHTGDPLVWDLILAPGGRVPNSHSHPEQEERFTVIDGTIKIRVGRRRRFARPGDIVTIPPGKVHHFANPGPVPVHVRVVSTPALLTEAMLETAAALARDQHAAGRTLPRPLDLALFMEDFDREVRAPYLPAPLVRAVLRPLRTLARSLGGDRRYRRLRHRPTAEPSVGSAAGPTAEPAAGQR
jgi:mannose-6-phosphate isomerase-like protein (cupin superfamily)